MALNNFLQKFVFSFSIGIIESYLFLHLNNMLIPFLFGGFLFTKITRLSDILVFTLSYIAGKSIFIFILYLQFKYQLQL